MFFNFGKPHSHNRITHPHDSFAMSSSFWQQPRISNFGLPTEPDTINLGVMAENCLLFFSPYSPTGSETIQERERLAQSLFKHIF